MMNLKSELSRFALASLSLFLVGLLSAEDVEITILHTNDIHQNLERLPRIAGYVADCRAAQPNMLFLDAGDWFDRGSSLVTLTQGDALYGAMAGMGYDAWVVGNHDWAYGGARLVELMETYPVPVLATNLATTRPSLPENIVSTMVKDFDGIRVGLFGITLDTYGKSAKSRPNLYVLDCRESASKAVADLKDQGADIIVAVTHLGFEKMSHEKGRSFHPSDQDLVRENPDIDVVIGGHSHQLLKEETIRDVHRETGSIITQAGALATYVGRLTLQVDKEARSISSFEVEAIRVTDALPVHTETASLIKQQYDEHMPNAKAVVGEFKLPMPLHSLAFWYADFIRDQAEVDICLLPRKTLYDEPRSFKGGALTVETLKGYLYDRHLIKGTVRGAELLAYCDSDSMRDRFNPFHHQGRPFSGNALFYSGFEATFEEEGKAVKFTIDPDKLYTVVVPWPFGRSIGALPSLGEAGKAVPIESLPLRDSEVLPLSTHERLVRDGLAGALDFYSHPPRDPSSWESWTMHFEAKQK